MEHTQESMHALVTGLSYAFCRVTASSIDLKQTNDGHLKQNRAAKTITTRKMYWDIQWMRQIFALWNSHFSLRSPRSISKAHCKHPGKSPTPTTTGQKTWLKALLPTIKHERPFLIENCGYVKHTTSPFFKNVPFYIEWWVKDTKHTQCETG